MRCITISDSFRAHGSRYAVGVSRVSAYRRLDLAAVSVLAMAALAGSGAQSASAQTSIYTTPTTGVSFIVPTGVTSITIEAWGGGGAGGYASSYPLGIGGSGGAGGFAGGTFSVTPNELLTILVGGGGFMEVADPNSGGLNGGGGTYDSGGGGGYSAVYDGTTAGTLLVVAGGGGGGGEQYGSGVNGGDGGAGGGGMGQTGDVGGTGGGGGSPLGPGMAGSGNRGNAQPGNGMNGGAALVHTPGSSNGGGGGGGYYGGGQGGYENDYYATAGGGGGGGSYVASSARNASLISGNPTASPGDNTVAGNSTSLDYVAGVGVGTSSGNQYIATAIGGSGEVFLRYSVGSPSTSSFVWSGGGADNNITSGGNWVGGTPPGTSNNVDLTFDGSARLSPNLDIAYSVNSVSFAATAGAFTLGGSQLTIGAGGLTQSSTTVLEKISTSGLVLGADQAWHVASGGLDVFSAITGNGALSLTQAGSGFTTFFGNSNYAGTATLNSGTLQITGSGSYGTIISTGSGSTLAIYSGSVGMTRALNGGTVDINGGTVSIDASSDGIVNVYAGAVVGATVGDPATINIYGGTFSSAIENADPTQSEINFFGSSFALTNGHQDGSNVDWLLTGTLSDGETLDTEYVEDGAANTAAPQGITFNSISGAASAPEPNALALLLPAISAIGLAAARRRRKRMRIS